MDTPESTPEEHVLALLAGRERIVGSRLFAWREDRWVFVESFDEPYRATVLINDQWFVVTIPVPVY